MHDRRGRGVSARQLEVGRRRTREGACAPSGRVPAAHVRAGAGIRQQPGAAPCRLVRAPRRGGSHVEAPHDEDGAQSGDPAASAAGTSSTVWGWRARRGSWWSTWWCTSSRTCACPTTVLLSTRLWTPASPAGASSAVGSTAAARDGLGPTPPRGIAVGSDPLLGEIHRRDVKRGRVGGMEDEPSRRSLRANSSCISMRSPGTGSPSV